MTSDIPRSVQDQLASRRWLTSKAYEALAVDDPATVVLVPLLDLPWLEDAARPAPVTVTVHPLDVDAIRAEGYHAGLRDGRRS